MEIIDQEDDYKLDTVNNYNRKNFRKEKREQLKQKIFQKIEDYYSGSYSGVSVAGLFYHLSQQLNRENNQQLWLWIQGLTD